MSADIFLIGKRKHIGRETMSSSYRKKLILRGHLWSQTLLLRGKTRGRSGGMEQNSSQSATKERNNLLE